MTLDLRGLPEKFCIALRRMLEDERCTPDAILFLADALETFAAEPQLGNAMTLSIKRLAADLRDKAPEYDRHV